MASNIHKLHSGTSNKDDVVAIVTEAAGGEACMIDIGGTSYPVADHLSSVEALNAGDRVLVTRSDEGFIVTGRLRAKDEAPAPRLETRDGHLVMKAARSVRLQAGDHRIEVRADGHIELDGREITGHAEGRFKLLGATIELN